MRSCMMVLFCLAALCPLAARIPVCADDTLTMQVGLYENPPKVFTDSNGEAAGFWPDIVRYIARKEGWNVEYIHGSWAQCLDRLEAGELDMMVDVARTPERARRYAFCNEVVYTSWATVYAGEGADIESVVDLEGKTVAVLSGSVNVEGPGGVRELAAAFDIDCTFIEADSYESVFELVKEGTADAGVTSKDHGYQHREDFDLEETPIIFQPSLLYFAFPKNAGLTPTLIAGVDRNVRSLKGDADSVYYESLNRWFAREADTAPVVPTWLVVSLVVAAGVAILLGAGDYVLRHQVMTRTAALTAEVARRREAEGQLARSHENLEELVRQRTAELEEANRHKSQFLANMSHELRTPLNSIIGYTKLMLDGMDGHVTDEQQEDLQTVYDNSRHLLSLINDLLDLSKIEAGKFEIVKDEFPVSDLIAQIVPSMQKLAADKGIDLAWTVAPGVESIYADKNKTKQILFNLLGNAVKFTERGSVRLDIDRRDGEVVLSITDTGIGIAEKDLKGLFQSYKQVGPARLDGFEGTGLGLVITRQFVELQGGSIWVESKPGQGSTFAFTLPEKVDGHGEASW